MDSELQNKAQKALLVAFWRDYGGLVESYMEAAYGLDTDTFTHRLQEQSNVMSHRRGAGDIFINLYGAWPDFVFGRETTGYPNFAAAFADPRPRELFLNGKRVFKRNELDEWVYCGD